MTLLQGPISSSSSDSNTNIWHVTTKRPRAQHKMLLRLYTVGIYTWLNYCPCIYSNSILNFYKTAFGNDLVYTQGIFYSQRVSICY